MEGINRIKIKSPDKSGELKFVSEGLKLVFYVNKSGSNAKVIKEALTEADSNNFLYDLEFYQFITQTIKTKNIVYKSNVDSLDRRFAEWNLILNTYQGRTPIRSWYLENGKPVKMRFYFTDLLINGKKPFVECTVDCDKSQISWINPIKFPTSNWCFGYR
jgi:hypothetical protein